MTDKHDGGPFHSLRDWFAGQALAGLLASGPHDCEPPDYAHDAYVLADAMLAAREGGKRQEAEPRGFKVGDRVKVIGDFAQDSIGTVVEFTNGGRVVVYCNHAGYNFDPSEITHLDPAP